MKRFSIFGLFLALCTVAAPVQADVCDEPIDLVVVLPDEFLQTTQDTLLYGGTLRYDVIVSRPVGEVSKVTLDFVIDVETKDVTKVGGVRASTFTRPRAQVNVNSTERAVKENRPLEVGRETTQVCLSVYAHPAGGQCGATASADVRAAQEVGSVRKCISWVTE